ncbi:FG-GAP-like repeat-containing protein [Streptomyces abikoensis]|uniref:FG-GAP-like repeat-containing protein n=1 Tax=Streptomyces abikoensis TaxID=97398 RepID=UPI003690DE26
MTAAAVIVGMAWSASTLLGSTESGAAAPKKKAASPPPPSWTRTWGTVMATATAADRSGVTGRETLRMVVHTSIAGTSTRIHLVNTFSEEPVTIGRATLARQAKAASTSAEPIPLTFGGNASTVIEPGGSIFSDAAAFPVNADENLLVSIHLPNPVKTAPFHEYTLNTSYTSAPGDAADRTMETGGSHFTRKFPRWAFLTGVDVMASSGGTVVLLGDSQTDGGHTTIDGNRRWPDAYGRALQAGEIPPMGIVNAGISANRLLTDGKPTEFGQSALNRFDRDVLAQPNVKAVILYEGINDIAFTDATASDVVTGIQQLAIRARSAGVSFTVATIPPFKGFRAYTPAKDKIRQEVNDYIRSTHDIDAYVDFDQATRDPLNPSRLFAAYYNRGDDRLHYGDNGSQALSDVVAPARPVTPLSPGPSETTSADFNGDGIPDLVFLDAKGELRLRPGNKDIDGSGQGDGTFGNPKRLLQSWNHTGIVAADFNGDGKADLIAKDRNNDLLLWAGKGNSTFAQPKKVASGWTSTQTVAADFTGDGVPDLVGRDAKGGLSIWLGSKNVTFNHHRTVLKSWKFTENVAGDFNGDGKADLISKDGSGNLFLWAGNGDGTFSNAKRLTKGWNYSGLTALTFSGRGITHLVGRNDETGVLQEWLNTGNASFSRPLRLADSW